MTTPLTSALSHLTTDDPQENIASIKNAIAQMIRNSDMGVGIKTTDYFNHTYAPDLLLTWPDEKEPRRVYLKTASNPEYLAEDVQILEGTRPIVVSLSPVVGGDDDGWAGLDEISRGTRTLVTDAPGLDSLAARRKSQPVVGFLSRAVLQGGRGVVDETAATDAGQAVVDGVAGAGVADLGSTQRALASVDSLLDDVRAGQLTRLLQAVWLGSGASPASFPGVAQVNAAMDPDALLFLLTSTDIPDLDFWRRIASALTLSRLVAIELSEDSENLQRLLSVSVGRLKPKSCRVYSVDEKRDGELRWSVRNEMLVLHGRRFDAFFSTKPSWKMDLPDVPRTTLSLRELLNRARSVDVELGELELATADGRRVKYADPNETDIAQDGRLVDVGDALGRDAYVRYAVALISGGARHMRCQFERGTASARTNGTFYLSEMLGIGLPLLERLRAGDQRAIRELISNDDPAEAL